MGTSLDSLIAVGGFKSLGDDGWEGVFTNIFYDREISSRAPLGERFSLEGMKEYAGWANEDPTNNMPDLWFWHLSDVKMGRAHTIEVIGPFLYAAGDWAEDEVGQKCKAFFGSEEASGQQWAMSHGYKYFLNDYVDGTLNRFRSYELTVLTEKWAANQVTFFTEGEMADKVKGLKEDLVAALQTVIGVSPGEAEKVATEGLENQKALAEGEAAGQKDTENASQDGASSEDQGGEDEAPAEGSDAGSEDEPVVEEDTLAIALAEALAQNGEVAAKVVAIEQGLKQLAQVVAAMQGSIVEDVKALKAESSARKELLPKAVAEALTARTQKGLTVEPSEVTADVNKVGQDLTGQKSHEEDPLGWLADLAGLHLPDGPAGQ